MKKVAVIFEIELNCEGIATDGSVEVRLAGWANFHVYPWEIIEIFGEPKGSNNAKKE